MRLIDADALIRKFKTASPMAIDGRAKQMVEEMPTIEERKKGKWTKDNGCQFCGFQPWFERDIHTLSFCPKCGADMRGNQ